MRVRCAGVAVGGGGRREHGEHRAVAKRSSHNLHPVAAALAATAVTASITSTAVAAAEPAALAAALAATAVTTPLAAATLAAADTPAMRW